MTRKRIFIVLIGLFVIFIGIMLVISLSRPKITLEKDPERANSARVVIKDSSDILFSSLSTNDYIMTKDAITSYIASVDGDPYGEVIITNVKPPFREGNVTTFTITIPELQKTVQATLTISLNGASPSTFAVPAENFITELRDVNYPD